MQGSQHGTGAGKEPSCLGRGGSACAARKPRLAAGVVCGGRAASSSSGPVRPKPENVSPRPHVGKRAPPAAAPVGTGCAGSPAGGCAGLAAERGWAARPAAAVGGGGGGQTVWLMCRSPPSSVAAGSAPYARRDRPEESGLRSAPPSPASAAPGGSRPGPRGRPLGTALLLVPRHGLGERKIAWVLLLFCFGWSFLEAGKQAGK